MNIFDNPNNNDSYQILTRELIRYDFADELAFAFNPKAFIQDIPNSKGTAGSNKILKTIRDTYYAVEPYKHSDGESYEKYFRSLLFEYLEKVRDENASVKENVKALIETFLYIGEFLLVADLIESEYKVFAHEAETCNNVLDKPNRIYVHAYDFSELYGQAGDYLLFLKGDTQLALRFYKLAGLQWVAKIGSPLNDILSDAYYEAVKKAKKWIMVYEKFEALSKPNTTDMNWLGDNIYRVLYNLYYEAKKLSISDVWKNAEMFYNSVPFADDVNKNLSTYERKNQIDILRVPIYMANIYRQENLKKVACYVASEIKKGKLSQDIYSNALYRVAEKTEETVFTYIDNSDKDARDKRNLLVSSLAMIYYVERIKEELTVKKFDKEYAYYTSLNTFNYMLPSEDKEDDAPGLLSIMHMSYMNDPNEGKILPSLIGLDTSIPYRKDATIPFVFLKCFTPRIDFLPMWKIYGDDAKGVCLVVDTEESFHKHSTPIYQICYVKKEKNKLQIQAKENASISPKSVKEIKEQIAIIGSLCKEIGIEWLINYLVSGIKYLFKDASYSYEEEVRILQVVSDGTSELIKKTPPIKDTNGDNILLSNKLYVATDAPICFEEVILGPKFENKSDRIPYLQRKIELMCKKIALRNRELLILALFTDSVLIVSHTTIVINVEIILHKRSVVNMRCKRCNKFFLFNAKSGCCKDCDVIIAKEEHLRREEEECKRLEQERLRREEEERKRIEQERLRREEEERKRIEQERLRREEEERKRIEQERLHREEEKRKRIEQERLRHEEEECKRIEQERLRREEEKRKRLEQERLHREEEERKQLEQERLRREEEERKRLEQERLRREEEERKQLESINERELNIRNQRIQKETRGMEMAVSQGTVIEYLRQCIDDDMARLRVYTDRKKLDDLYEEYISDISYGSITAFQKLYVSRIKSEYSGTATCREIVKKEFAAFFSLVQKYVKVGDVYTPQDFFNRVIALKRKGSYVSASREYMLTAIADYILADNVAMAWMKVLAAAGDVEDAIKLGSYMIIEGDNVYHRDMNAHNMLILNTGDLMDFSEGKRWDELAARLKEIAGGFADIKIEDVDVYINAQKNI